MACKQKTLVFSKIPAGFPVAGEHHPDGRGPPHRPRRGRARRRWPGDQGLYASYDPYMRGRMRDASIKSYVPAFDLGGAVANNTVSKVIKSDSADFAEGELVVGLLPIASTPASP